MVGDILRGEREKQGLTIDDIARETSIRDAYLEAIEKGDYDALPGDVYAKGFIRNYSRFLQLDGDALLQKYDEERNITKTVQPVDKQKADEPKKPAGHHSLFGRGKEKKEASEKQQPADHSVSAAQPEKPKNLFAAGDAYRNSLEKEEKSGSKKFMILLGAMVVFLGGVYIAFMDDGTEPAPKETVQVEEAQQPAPPAEKKYDDVEITAKALENCWISVKADGQTIFEGTIEKGKEMSWKGKESIEILAGNAGGIQITYNGKDAGTLGQIGQVAERTFKKNEDVKPAEQPALQQESAQTSTYEEKRSYRESHYSAPEPVQQSAPVVQAEAPKAQEAPAAAAEPAAPAPAPTQEAQPAPAAEAAPAATPQG